MVLVVAVLGCSATPTPRTKPIRVTTASMAPDPRLVFARRVLAAMASGDVERLVRLADPIGLRRRVTECKKGSVDPQRYVDSAREMYTYSVEHAKGLTIEILGLAHTASSDADGDTDEHVLKKGADVGGNCVAKIDLELQKISVDVQVRRGSEPVEQVLDIEALEIDGHWYLIDIPHRIREHDRGIGLER